ncbi:hypothetical protein BR93DRAFT_978551 [Coniochaeta sp. PMI_546]|nr:hypothetical protein BR93DRAFT_978551 [Coniochaeta sp. PMI_546]
MASSSSQPPPLNPPHPSPPSVTSTSPPASTTPSTATTNPQASTISPPALPSTAGSSLSSPQFPPPGAALGPGPGPGPHHVHHPHPHPQSSNLSSTLPPSSASSQRQISEARQAVLASIGNMLDASLRDRASVLHSNAAAIAKQERDVARATDALRRENDRLARVAGDAAKKVKELGNVQNWAEVLESDFLALEETIRLVREGSTGSEGSWSGSGSGSWSGSEGGDEGDGDGDVRMGDEDGEGREERRVGRVDKGKAKERDQGADDRMDVDGAPGASGHSVLGTGNLASGDVVTDVPDQHVPAVENIEREAPSITVPGIEPSQTSTVSLEDELRSAMDQPIGHTE